MAELFHLLNSLSPLGVIGLLAYIIYLQVKGHRKVQHLGENHLSTLPDIAASLSRVEGLLQNVHDTFIYLKARSNGK